MKKLFIVLVVGLFISSLLVSQQLPIKKLTKAKPVPLKAFKFKIQGIKRILTTPSKVKFQVQYYISRTYRKPCFIGARIVGTNNYSFKPAGRLPNGVRKGQIHFTHNVAVEVNYTGANPFTSRQLEVMIYDQSKTLTSTKINWGQTWDKNAYRFEVQGIKRILTTPSKIKFQVQYYISPAYPKPCFIGTGIVGTNQYAYIPAGRLPNGVRKGQVHFTHNVVVELNYTGANPFTSRQLRVMIYDQQKTLASTNINWGQTWSKNSYRFQVQGIKRILTTPSKVKFQVQYYISPTYPKPCFIGAKIVGTRNYSFRPAGRLPNGVHKGQVHFTHNVVVELDYNGSSPYTSRQLEVLIYDQSKTHTSTKINWGQTWRK